MRLGLYPAELAEGTRGRARPTAPPRSRSGTGTATRSTTPTASSWRRPGWCSPASARRTAWWSSSSCPRDGAPLLRRHPGAPRAAVAPDPAAPAVRRARRGRGRPADGAGDPRRRGRAAACERRRRGGSTSLTGEPAPSRLADRPRARGRSHASEDVLRRLGALRRAPGRASPTPAGRERVHAGVVVEHPGAVVVLAVDDDGARAGAAAVPAPRAACGSWSCPPACSTSQGEDPLVAAAASCSRRAALAADEWTARSARAPSPGYQRRADRVYLARGLRAVPGPRRLRASSTRRPT